MNVAGVTPELVTIRGVGTLVLRACGRCRRMLIAKALTRAGLCAACRNLGNTPRTDTPTFTKLVANIDRKAEREREREREQARMAAEPIVARGAANPRPLPEVFESELGLRLVAALDELERPVRRLEVLMPDLASAVTRELARVDEPVLEERAPRPLEYRWALRPPVERAEPWRGFGAPRPVDLPPGAKSALAEMSPEGRDVLEGVCRELAVTAKRVRRPSRGNSAVDPSGIHPPSEGSQSDPGGSPSDPSVEDRSPPGRSDPTPEPSPLAAPVVRETTREATTRAPDTRKSSAPARRVKAKKSHSAAARGLAPTPRRPPSPPRREAGQRAPRVLSPDEQLRRVLAEMDRDIARLRRPA